MTQNEQNFINKINEQSSIIEWQKLALSERDKRIEALQEPKTCNGCAYYNDFFKGGCSTNHSCIRKSTDHYEPKQ